MKVANSLSGQEVFALKRALLIYESQESALATVHDVANRQSGPPLLLSGRCLTRATLDEMTRKLAGAPQKRVLLPANILCYDSGRMVWHTTAQRRPIYFRSRSESWNRVMSGRCVLHPPLLFMAEARKLSVFALESDGRPEESTRLFRAPYFNLYSAGNMCNGNARIPERVFLEDIPIWEEAFFGTNFTHNNSGSQLSLHPRGHTGLWWYLSQPRIKEFPTRFLRPLPQKWTLQQVINQ